MSTGKLQALVVLAIWLLPGCADFQNKLATTDTAKNASEAKRINNPAVDSKEERASVKQAAIEFFKWLENDWYNEKLGTISKSQKFFSENILLSNRKNSESCPCTIDWKALNKFYTMISESTPVISNRYLEYYRQKMKDLEPILKKRIVANDFYALEEEFFEAFHFMPGQDFPSDFKETGLYDNTSVWDIHFRGNDTAEVNVTFTLPPDWGGGPAAYRMKMIKENDDWKLAANLDEGTISPAYKAK